MLTPSWKTLFQISTTTGTLPLVQYIEDYASKDADKDAGGNTVIKCMDTSPQALNRMKVKKLRDICAVLEKAFTKDQIIQRMKANLKDFMLADIEKMVHALAVLRFHKEPSEQLAQTFLSGGIAKIIKRSHDYSKPGASQIAACKAALLGIADTEDATR